MKKFRLNRIMAALAVSAVLLNQNGIYILADENVPAQMMEAEGEIAALSAETQLPETELKTEAPTEAPTPAPTEAPTEAATPAPTEAPTEAPTPAPTEAPTEAPTPAPTEAPTEAPTPAPTEAPTEASTPALTEAPTEEAPSPQTESADLPDVIETESQAAESETEKKTETPLLEMDTEEETVSSLSAQAGGVSVTLRLPDGVEISEDAKLIVTEITASDGGVYENALSRVKEKTEKGHRQLADLLVYRIEVEEDGNKSFPAGNVTLSFAWSKPIDLGILPWMQGEAFVFRLGNEAEQIGEISLDPDSSDDRSFTGFEISGKELSLIAAAGVQNRVPTGKKTEKSDLLRALEDLTDYSVVANHFESSGEIPEGLLAGEIAGQAAENAEAAEDTTDTAGPEETPETTDAAGPEETGETADTTASAEAEDSVKTNSAEDQADAGKLLQNVSEKSLSLANSISSGNVTFVTVYADEEGRIDDEPLGAVRVVTDSGKEYLNVTDTMLVINIVAAKTDQKLTLPDWRLINTDSTEGAHVEGTAGKVLYNLAAMNGRELKSYEGTLTVKDECEGTILAPKARVIAQKTIAGAVYADSVSLENEAQIENVTLGSVYQAEPAEDTKVLEEQQDFEQSDPEEKMGDVKPEALIRITVNAVLDGESPSALPEDTEFGIVDEQGSALVDVLGNKLPPKPIKGGDGSVDFNIDTSNYDLFIEKAAEGGTVKLKVVPTSTVSQYKLVSSEPADAIVTVTITPPEGETPGNVTSDPAAVTFHYEKIPKDSTIFSLGIAAQQNTKEKEKLPTGTEAVYVIKDKDGKELTPKGSDKPETFIIKDGKDLSKTFDAKNYDVFENIELGKEETFTLVEQSVTSPWEAQNKEQSFIVGKDADGKYYITDKTGGTPHSGEKDPLNVTFVYKKTSQYIALTIRALQKANSKAMPAESTKFQIRKSDGTVIPVQKKETISFKGKGAVLTINTSTTSPFKDLEPGKTLKLEVVNTEWPYGWLPDTTQYSVVVARASDGTYSVWQEDIPDEKHAGKDDPLVMPFLYSQETVTFNVSELDEKTQKIGLAGGKIAVRLPDGSALNIKTGEMKKTAASVTVDKKEGITVEIPLTENPAFAELLQKNGKVNLTVVALTAPVDPAGYAFSTKSGTEYALTVTKKDAQTQAAASPKTVKILFKKGSATLTSDSVQVVKYVYSGENTGIYHTGKQNYYVALFKDKKLTQRVTDVKVIAFKGSSLTASTVFNHLEPGKYYVGETDETGRLVGREKNKKKAKDPYYVEYSAQEVTVNGITNKTIRVNMGNHYFVMPENTEYYGVVKVTKKVLDEEGKAKKNNGTFYFRVNNDKKNIRRINMGGQDTASINVYVRMTDTTKKIKITEVKPRVKNGAYVKDTDGNYVFDEMKSSNTWTVSYKNQTVTLRQGQTDTPEVTITNQEVNKKETESETGKKKETETGAGADTAVITVVKKATYKGNPIRLNSTFYIGIFEDASLKKIKASPMKMTLKDLSEKSREIKVNLYILPKKNRSVTMYFAETDASGKPLKSGQNGYTISPAGAVKVTVDPQHPKATVTFTNNIEGGSKLEDRLRDSSSGLAGDASAIEDSYKGIGGTADGGSGTSAKTGDETPLALWLGTLLLGLLTAWLMLRKLSCQRDEKTL